MSSIDDARDLIADSRKRFVLIREGCSRSLQAKRIERQLPIDIKHCLENLRSALDYTAQHLFMRFGKRSKKRTYFPYVGKSASGREFRKRVEETIPGLSGARPDIVSVLETFQDYHRSSDWLSSLMYLTNKSKHVELNPQKRIQQKGVKISAGKHEIVTPKIVVQPGGQFVVSGKEIPAGEYGADNLPDVGPSATAEIETWESIHFTANGKEVISFIDHSIDLVAAIVENTAAF